MNDRRSSLQKRLAGAAACLERLEQARRVRGDPTLGKAVEEGIISRELLDLELQEFDEEIGHLAEVAQNPRTWELAAAVDGS